MFNSAVSHVPCGTGYIAWPNDIDRDEYMKDCYMNGRISLWLEDGSLVNRAICAQSALSKINFPTKPTEKGSAVVFVSEAIHNTPIVIDVLQDLNQIGVLKEGQFVYSKTHEDRTVSFSGDVKNGSIGINLSAGSKKGKFIMNIDNDKSDCEVDINIQGKWKTSVRNQMLMVSEEEIKLVIDHLGDRPSLVKIKENEIVLSSASLKFSGKDIFIKTDNGVEIILNDKGILINGQNSPIFMQSGESKVKIDKKKITVEADKININGRYPAVYCKTPSMPITRVEQLGVSKKITIG